MLMEKKRVVFMSQCAEDKQTVVLDNCGGLGVASDTTAALGERSDTWVHRADKVTSQVESVQQNTG